MKLLLTSAGLKNKTLIDEFLKLVDKPASGIKLAYIPTAANVEPDGKGWMIDNLCEFKNLVSEVDIVEIAALPSSAFMPRLEWADVIAIGGGNPYFLLNWIRKSGLDVEIRNLLESRVFVGISAGSMVAGPDISITNDMLPEVVKFELNDYMGLQFVDFEIVPHYNSESFSKVREPELKKYQQKSKVPFYVIDDQSAIKVVDKNIEPVGEGEWWEIVLMKLLLTSDGLTTKQLQNVLIDLAGKPFAELNFACITTAINRDDGDKTKKVNRISALHGLGFAKFDLVDVAAIDKEYWLPRLEEADVIFILGGNTYYLLDEVIKSGLADELPRLLETRVYVGDSAGSILVTPSIDVAEIDDGDENIVDIKDTSGLGLVDFEVSPHTPEDVSLKANEDYAKTIENKLIAYDNNMAVKVEGDSVELVGDGKYWEYNK